MSGITAVLSRDRRPVAETLARAQLDAITHRGDADRPPRLWLGQEVALGHVGAPTTQEAEHEQLPAPDATGRYWLTWDGRIDNRAELANALRLDAPAARAMTDADYVRAAFARWGEDCVHHLLGDWAVIIWDAHSRRLFAAKDPLGWRQLFYVTADGVLALGSEPRQLFAGGLIRPEANQEYVHRYLAGAMQEPGVTCYAGVQELEGGQILTASDDGPIAVRTYWRRPRAAVGPFRRPEDVVDAFEAVFREAVRARLRSGRKLGVFLSGGLDSSYVAAVAAQQGASVKAITAFAPGTRWLDERPYARALTGYLGIEHAEIDIADCWALSRHRLAAGVFDEATHPPQGAMMVRLAQAAHESGVGTVLRGEGGDERMIGDDRFIADALLHGKLASALRLARHVEPARPVWRTVAVSCVRALAPNPVQDAIARRRRRTAGAPVAPLVAPDRRWRSHANQERTTLWPRRRALGREWQVYRDVVRTIVPWQDRHAFAPFRVDQRSPFQDLRIVELMASTPEWMKRYGGRPKDLLRAAAARVLPDGIVDQRGNGIFNELLVDGLATEEQRRVREAVEAVTSFPGVQCSNARAEVARWTAEARAARDPTRHVLTTWQPTWRLVTVGLWLRNLEVPRSHVAGDGPHSPGAFTAAVTEGR